jgi:hypothetical protein
VKSYIRLTQRLRYQDPFAWARRNHTLIYPSAGHSWDMDTVIFTILLMVILNDAVLYFRNRKTQRMPLVDIQINSEQNEKDADREMPPTLDSPNAVEDGHVVVSEISTTLVPTQESRSLVLQDSNASHRWQSPSTCTPCTSSAPPPAHALIVSYQEIVSAITRYVLFGFFARMRPKSIAEAEPRA